MITFTKSVYTLFIIFIFALKATAQTADFIADKISGCNPLAVNFTDKSTGSVSSWSWDFGDSKYSTLPNPGTTYVTPGTFTVKLTVKNASGGTSVKTMTITVYPSPTVKFTASPSKACPCETIFFTNTSSPNAPGAITSLWAFGDGADAATNNTSHIYCTPGLYNVTLKVTNSVGCVSTKTDTGKVEILEKPVADFSASKTKLCRVPDSVIFTPSVSGGKAPYTYKWDFGDGFGTSTASSPKYTYSSTGSFKVTLVVTDANGCKDTMVRDGFITSYIMNASFSMPASICAGANLARFDNTSSPVPTTTTWSWSDGAPSASGSFAQRPFWKGGSFTVTMIDEYAPGCVDTAVKTYIVNPKPKPNFTYSPIYPCPAPATITFTNKSSGADSFYWIFGDGTNSKLKDPVHTYTWDSIFTVYMVAKTSFGCLDTFRVRDMSKEFPDGYPKVRGSFALPTYDSANSPVIIRVHKADLLITVDSNSGCLPFYIDPIATMCGRSKLPADTGRFCSSPKGYSYPPYWKCAFDGSATDFYADEYADPYTVLSKTSCIDDPHPYPITSYYWDFGDGYTTTADSPTHTYTTEGNFTLKVRVTTHNGCTYTDSILVSAGNQPIADFIATPQNVCIHDTVTFTNKSHKGITYTWRFGEGGYYTTTDSAAIYKYRYDLSDTFLVVLTAYRYGCRDTASARIIVHPPQVNYTLKYFCDSPMKVAFYDTSKGATSYLWRFGDGATSTLKDPIHKYSLPGKYTVWHIVYNDLYGCSDSISFDVSLFIAEPFFTASDTVICAGEKVKFTDVSKSYFENWYWSSNGKSQKDIAGGFEVEYKTSGRYDVLYVARDIHGCYDTFSRKNYILVTKPVMKLIASPIKACAPSLVSFADSSTNVSGVKNVIRTWIWGDATTKTDTSIFASKLYSVPGTYTVKLRTTDEYGCKDSTDIVIEARKPKADFRVAFDTITCVGKPNNFISTSKGDDLTYKWDFGDGETGTGATPTHIYKTLGTFTVTLWIVDGTGCKDSVTKLAYMKTVRPGASFTMSDSMALCPPLFIKFTNTSSDSLRSFWDFDNGSKSVMPSPVALYADSGTYNIMLVVTDKYGCTDTAYKRARLLGYDGLLKYAPLSGCAPHEVSFEAEPINAEVMVWDFADGVTESAVGKLKTKHIYTVPGAYVPRLILGDGKGCSTSSKGLDTIKVDGTIAFISHTPACINTPVTFNDSSFSYFSTHASSEWTFEDGTTATGKNPVRTYTKTGTYTVTLISTNTNGCKDTIQTSIVVLPLPVITAIDTVICLGDQAALKATGGVSYTWDPSPTLSCSDCNSPLTNTRVPARYFVTGTDKNGCSNRDTLDVGIKTKTTLILAEDAEICELTPIQLNASGAQTYAWSPATFLSDPNIANPVATMENTVVYRVIGTEGSCIPDTGFIKVTVHPLPDVNAGPDQKVLAGTEVQLSGSGTNIKDYRWTPAATLSCDDCTAPTAKPLFTTTYTLKGTSEFGCSDSDDVVITIFCDQSQLFIPNTFTPNGDGQNDYFYPQGKGVAKIKSFIIFNRWGQKVYQRTNIDANIREQGWDGSFKGEALNPDTFVYTLEAACDNGELVFWKGDVTLIK